jgi:hypothetical protein
MKTLFLAVFAVSFVTSLQHSLTAAGAKPEAQKITEDPARPTTLDPRDPSFSTLTETSYKPNATYVIRDFKKGTVQSLEGMLGAVRNRSQDNLKMIRTLQDEAHRLEFTDLEKFVTGLADLRQKQVDTLRKIDTYASGIYQTNLSMDSLRKEVAAIDIDVQNMKQLLAAWRKDNSVAWE